MEKARKVRSDCVNASNPFHACSEYCRGGVGGHKPSSSSSSEPRGGRTPVQNVEKINGGGGGGGERRQVDPSCPNASNPFHQCSNYCKGKMPGAGAVKKRVEVGRTAVTNVEKINWGGGAGGERRHVDPSCPNASNPFHQCSNYCKGKMLAAAKKRVEVGRTVVAAHNGQRSKEAGEGRHVDPSCVNASNPFHQCGEYCARRMNKGGRAGFVWKLKIAPGFYYLRVSYSFKALWLTL